MKYFFSIFTLGMLLSLTSCIEIVDELDINEDGSGTFKYTVNISSSKVKLNSYLALDSLDGKRVPSLEEIKGYVNDVVSSLKNQEGISNLSMESNYTDFIFKLKLDFNSVKHLQAAIKAVAQENSKKRFLEELNHNWLEYSGNSLARSIPKMNIERAKNLSAEETKLLKEGTYTSITRFVKEVDRFDNKDAILSKNKKAVMVRTDTYSLSQKNQLLDNTIYLKNSSGGN